MEYKRNSPTLSHYFGKITPWARVQLNKPIIVPLSKKLSAFCGNRKITAVVTGALQWSLTENMNPVHNDTHYSRKIHSDIILQSTPKSSKSFNPSGFQ